jgi:hypothetical protein
MARHYRGLAASALVLAGALLVPAAQADAADGGELTVIGSTYQTEVHAGGEYFVQSSVVNTGTVPLTGVTLVHEIPDGVAIRYGEGSYTDGENVDETVSGQSFVYTFPTLAVGERGVASIYGRVLDVPYGSVLETRITASSPESTLPTVAAASACADDPSSACLAVDVVPGARFSLALSADASSALRGDTVRFAVHVGNTGLVDGSVALTGYLPESFDLADGDFGPSGHPSLIPGYGEELRAEVELAAGESTTVFLAAILREAGLGSVLTTAVSADYFAGVVAYASPCAETTAVARARVYPGGCLETAVGRAVAPAAANPLVQPLPQPGPAELARTGFASQAPLLAAVLATLIGLALLLSGGRSRPSRRR